MKRVFALPNWGLSTDHDKQEADEETIRAGIDRSRDKIVGSKMVLPLPTKDGSDAVGVILAVDYADGVLTFEVEVDDDQLATDRGDD